MTSKLYILRVSVINQRGNGKPNQGRGGGKGDDLKEQTKIHLNYSMACVHISMSVCLSVVYSCLYVH